MRDLLASYPVPLVTWKTYAALDRLHSQLDEDRAGRADFAQAGAIVGQIADNVHDGQLRATFLNSTAVREIFEAGEAERTASEGRSLT